MDIKFIKRLVKILRQTYLTEIEYKDEIQRIRIAGA